MLTKLIFPPQWIPTQPYLSLPSLTAFLKANNCDVEQMDVNVSFYDDLLSKKALYTYFERAYSKFQELESGGELSPALQKKYATLSGSMLFGENVIKKVEIAKRTLRDKKKFYDLKELNGAFRILELGLQLASAAYYPSNLTFHSYDMRHSCRSSKAVLSAVADREENIFIDYFEKKTVPEILIDKPGIVGISIINTSQIIPGLTLASLLKKTDRNLHINIGGSVFTRLINEISGNRELFSVFDSLIVHEGENALLGLVKYLDGELAIQDVPNLIYYDGTRINLNRISPRGEDINSLPTPCFDGFPLELYLSPELVLPVLSSRGCYWRRCTFCDHSYGYSGKYRPRDVDLLYNDLKALKTKYKTNFFTFQDEGVAPKLMSALSDKILKDDLEISWLADSRFEQTFSAELGKKLAEAGCKMLYFGLESASDRVLKCMDKGIKKENVLDICKITTGAGIWTHLFLIFGFPTETRSEAAETMDFILQNKEIINSMSFGSFQLTKHSKVYEAPETFSVKKIYKDDGIDLSLWYGHEAGSGMSKREIDEVIEIFYNELSRRYRDLKIWSNLDREHLFLYISHYKKAKNKVTDLSEVVERAVLEKTKEKSFADEGRPALNEGVFAGTFNFNLAQIIQALTTGIVLDSSLLRERTNVLFDTNNNRVYTITDFGKDLLNSCNGEMKLSGIIDILKDKYQLTYSDAESRCKNLLKGFMSRNIILM